VDKSGSYHNDSCNSRGSKSNISKMQSKFFKDGYDNKITVNQIFEMKKKKEKVAIITAYDYSSALIYDKAGVDGVLVGDSAATVMLGYDNTNLIGMREMLVFCGAVSRAVKRALIIGDMPFGSYQSSHSKAVHNAVLFVKAGCDAVKIEGGAEVAPIIRSIVGAGIPVMGHIGFMPQTSRMWKNYKLHGKTTESALLLIEEAKELERAGAFGIVLEMVTDEVAALISQNLLIPTIGIGSGLNCDGQVLVSHDLLGMQEDVQLKFVNRYARLCEIIFGAVSLYTKDVKDKNFPQDTNCFHMNKDEFAKVLEKLNKEKKATG
jgi:3-methyl-2-oxobutanoate hydroxymethyltransferase